MTSDKNKKSKNPTDKACEIIGIKPSDCDPLGMWTGNPEESDKYPVQDSDDL